MTRPPQGSGGSGKFSVLALARDSSASGQRKGIFGLAAYAECISWRLRNKTAR